MFRHRRNLVGRRVLITGASSGIGRALALALARFETQLVLAARREDRLTELMEPIRQRGSTACFLAADITSPGRRAELVQLAVDRFGGLDVLVNNAGLGGIGSFVSANEQRLREVMEVNFFAAAELTRLAIPLLQDSDDGVVVNVGSVLGHCAVPNKSEYCASKFALHGLSDALRVELRELGIDVLLISPSTTGSEFFDKAMRSQGEALSVGRSMAPEVVAKHIIRALRTRRREMILSPGGKLLVWADRLAPGIVGRLLGKFG